MTLNKTPVTDWFTKNTKKKKNEKEKPIEIT